MNEWDLQHQLSIRFRNKKLKLSEIEFDLACWELMFPSWGINDKNKKWNEVSIDFIFYSEINNLFLCVELKNNLKTKKELLSAYCQTTHRTINFIEQYSIDKMLKARKECLEMDNLNRGGKSKVEPILFKDNPTVKRMLWANSFPKNYKDFIEELNNSSPSEILSIINKYKENNEMKRFKQIEHNRFECLNTQQLITHTIENFH